MSVQSDKIFNNIGVHVTLLDPEDFMVVRETLSRIGVSPKGKKILYQSCHLIHKNETYIVAHFKELFALDNLPSNVSEEDIKRRNTIVQLLNDWELLEVVDNEKIQNKMPITGLKIIKYNERDDWDLIPKFNPGSLRKFFNS
jgi:ABC-type arginine transport system ATPase subunit